METKRFGITEEQFNIAYNKYPASNWISFGYKHFSQDTVKKNKGLSTTIAIALIALFVAGFSATAFNLPNTIVAVATYSFAVILTVLVGYLFSVVFLNNSRLKKIAADLGVTIEEYNTLATIYS